MSMANEINTTHVKERQNFFVRAAKYFIPWKGDDVSEVFRKLMFIASIAVFVVSLDSLSDYLRADKQELTYFEEIRSLEPDFGDDNSSVSGDTVDTTDKKGTITKIENPVITVEPRELQDWALPLLERNDDVVGWLKIPGIKDGNGNAIINYPVLQHESSNDYYLHHNIDGAQTESGSIFADCVVPITLEGQADNITLYGHNMMAGTQFAALQKFKKGADFIKQNPLIEFNTIYEKNQKYVVLATFIGIDAEDQDGGEGAFDYWNYRNFDSDGHYSFETWKTNILKYSWIDNSIDFNEGDDFLTLSTCTYELGSYRTVRWVVVAKKMTVKDSLDEIVESYKDKADKDIYFFRAWRDTYGNKKVIVGS